MNKKIIFLIIGLIISAVFFIKTQPTFATTETVTSPTHDDYWGIGISHEITWTSYFNSPTVRILLMKGDNSSYQDIAYDVPNTGSYTWTPSPTTFSPGSYHIRILEQEYAGAMGESYLNFYLVLVQDGSLLSAPTLLSPENGLIVTTNKPNLQWYSVTNAKAYQYKIYDSSGTVELQSWDFDATYPSTQTFAISLTNGSYKWKVRACANLIKVVAPGDSTCGPWSSLWSFKVTLSSISLLSPNGGEQIVAGQPFTISWTQSVSEQVFIDLLNGTAPYIQIMIGNLYTAGTNNFLWNVASTTALGNNYKVRIMNYAQNVIDTSDANFSIIETPPLTCNNLWWFDNTSRICQAKTFCGAYMYFGLQTFPTQETCQTALSAQTPACTADVKLCPDGSYVSRTGSNCEFAACPLVSIPEGGLIRAIGDIDVYIVKYVGTKKFKRLILSPSVFNSYGHLHWSDIKDVDRSVFDSFTTSDLVRAVNDPKVYKLYPAGDTGEKRWVTTANVFNSMGYDWDSIYQINQVDRDSYITGQSIN